MANSAKTMNIAQNLSYDNDGAIICVDTHTVGMPCRIVVRGYPQLEGTLASQKAQAAKLFDHVRRLLLLEPRGHSNMFGAVLRPDTEMTASGEAYMGLFFIHSHGYSNMCGHGTIAKPLEFDPSTQTVRMVLHAPAGLIHATVPTTPDGRRSDPTRPVRIVPAAAYTLATDLIVTIPTDNKWPELRDRKTVRVAIACCGATCCVVDKHELGFPDDVLQGNLDFESLKYATTKLKNILNSGKYAEVLKNPLTGDAVSIFGVLISSRGQGKQLNDSKGVETSLYIFGDETVDRSPTGSVSASRNALAYARGELAEGESWTYQSFISNSIGSGQGFVAKILQAEGRKKIDQGGYAAGPVVVEVQGHAYYTGSHAFVVEDADPLGDDGFNPIKLVCP